MINPSEVGKAGEMVRLKTLEAIWIQGSCACGPLVYIGGGSGGNMFNQLLASGKVTKTSHQRSITPDEEVWHLGSLSLRRFFVKYSVGKNKSGRPSVHRR